MFMDSPGNDLESTAGQTASGCNFIAFTTGNGAVTNHPLVPTAKIITTTRRYQLVGADMDFNAGKNAPCYSCIALVLLFREKMFSHSHSLYFCFLLSFRFLFHVQVD
jgi:altronate dehydratase